MQVYKAINGVQAALAKVGITKDRKNLQQNYSFRGIDDVFNALSPLLAEHQLAIIPRYLTRECIERPSKSGGVLFNVTVEAEFDLYGSDGSHVTAKTFGEAMDSADKATNKAMSAAYKYMCFQVFAIPTEGDNDADAHTPVPVAATAPAAPKPAKKATPAVSNDPPELAAYIARLVDGLDAQNVKNELRAKLYKLGGQPLVDGVMADITASKMTPAEKVRIMWKAIQDNQPPEGV